MSDRELTEKEVEMSAVEINPRRAASRIWTRSDMLGLMQQLEAKQSGRNVGSTSFLNIITQIELVVVSLI